jgi:pSer/pThr/pTyr-binding forkhead associated (FHA) protein
MDGYGQTQVLDSTLEAFNQDTDNESDTSLTPKPRAFLVPVSSSAGRKATAEDEVTSFPLQQGLNIIGRAPLRDVNVVLRVPSVSKKHAELGRPLCGPL